ncbi:hypothetical protein CLAFUW4_14167 [Fulvia fulva]|nr:hypothetical protein CLAFUR4_14170 [Fulvia fulva]WPV22287.1 hypothetical protein CLAFUW4_14167 [Fulvia fulva]WPV37156.1 hypothetical protein CLAFUW7_14178 [Fulvia fulva]
MNTAFLYTALVAIFACAAPIAAQWVDPNCPTDRCMVIGLPEIRRCVKQSDGSPCNG